MILSDLEKAWLLFKLDNDARFGSRGKSMVENKNLSVFISLSEKGLVQTDDDVKKPYPGFTLTDNGEKQAYIIYQSITADDLEKLGKIITLEENRSLPLPRGSIFMAKKIAQQSKNNKKN